MLYLMNVRGRSWPLSRMGRMVAARSAHRPDAGRARRVWRARERGRAGGDALPLCFFGGWGWRAPLNPPMSNQLCKSAEFAMTRHSADACHSAKHQQRPRPRFGRRCPSLAGEEHSEAATLARASVGVVATSPASRGGLPRERASVRDRTARGLSTWRPRRRSRCAPHHSGARRRRIFSVSSSSLPAPSGVRSVKGRRRASPLPWRSRRRVSCWRRDASPPRLASRRAIGRRARRASTGFPAAPPARALDGESIAPPPARIPSSPRLFSLVRPPPSISPSQDGLARPKLTRESLVSGLSLGPKPPGSRPSGLGKTSRAPAFKVRAPTISRLVRSFQTNPFPATAARASASPLPGTLRRLRSTLTTLRASDPPRSSSHPSRARR